MRPRAALAAVLLVAALAPELFAAPYAVSDTLGRTLVFQKVPERIVLAGKGTLLLVDAVYLFPGAGARVVGVGATDQGLGDFFPFIDARGKAKARLANSVGPEQVAAIAPDLVILKSYNREKLGNALETVGVPVLYLDLESPEKFYADIATLGALFQQADRARMVTDWYRGRADAVARSVAGAPRPPVLVVQYSARDGQNAFTVPPAGWIQTAIVETAGGAVAWKEAGPGDGWKKIGIEQLAAWDPRYVLIVSYQEASAAVADRLATSATLKGIILPFPADFHSWDQPDSRWILGLEWLAVTLHPDVFPAMDMRGEVTAFYSQLYGIDGATIEREILPRVAGAIARK